ncbi:chromogranin-A [Cynoglossus semilaevis]|uniref:chromogranin-A n=1 Tax=Cynoglossus semilaevis TaxID=244447 RepID=UPI0004977BF7|nr:chromogranin-A [Cynoglossus semilaevis]
MIERGLFVVAVLTNCVLSLPVTSSQLENEDVKVMKCIVEALADVLSRPHPVPVSQECLTTLRTDDRLVTILRRRNFLKELQDIAVQGGRERAQLQKEVVDPNATPETTQNPSDRAMLEALGGQGERSIISEKRTGNGDEDGEKSQSLKHGGSEEENDATKEEEKRDKDESRERHLSESEEWSKEKAEKRQDEEVEEEEEELNKEKRGNSGEEAMTKNEKGVTTEEKREQSTHKLKKEQLQDGDHEENGKGSSISSHKREGEDKEVETKRGSKDNLTRWSKRGKGLQLKKNGEGEAAQRDSSPQEVLHHSKEVSANEEEEKKKKRDTKRSPEEKELQMIAGRAPEERSLEEEGSASRKSEEPEIESLAAIESELENVAQKLHELRRG